jgi:hypothetical protein
MNSGLLRLATLAALLLAAKLPAQTDLSAGTRVRAFAPAVSDQRLVGRVSAATADSLMLTRPDGASIALSRPAIERLEVSRGHARVKWALIGAGAGLIVGGVIGGAMGGDDDTSGLGAAEGFTAGALQGIVLGGVAGALLAPERWRELPAH